MRKPSSFRRRRRSVAPHPRFRIKPDPCTAHCQTARRAEREVESATVRPRVVLAPLFPERSAQQKAATARRVRQAFGYAPNCPECGTRMISRTVRQGETAGRKFWSCARYGWEESPCSGTLPSSGHPVK